MNRNARLYLTCAMVYAIGIGAWYSSSPLAVLKITLMKQMNISNSQYGLLLSAESLVNTLIPFIGGLLIGTIGPKSSAVLTSVTIVISNVILSVATYLDDSSAFAVMALGRVVYGIAFGLVVMTQEVIFANITLFSRDLYQSHPSSGGVKDPNSKKKDWWKKLVTLGMVMGFSVSVSRAAQWVATVSSVPISKSTGFYGNAFWVSTAVSSFSFICSLVLYTLLSSFECTPVASTRHCKSALVNESKVTAGSEDCKDVEIFDISKTLKPPASLYDQLVSILHFGHSTWLIMYLSFCFGLASYGFQYILPGYLATLHDVAPKAASTEAAWKTSISIALSIILSPITGMLLDNVGFRPVAFLVAGISLVLAISLIGFDATSSSSSVIIGLVFLSIGSTAGPVAEIASIPLTLSREVDIAVAIGLFRSIGNAGACIINPLLGHLQDVSQSYHSSLIVLDCCAAAYILLSVVLIIVSYKGWPLSRTSLLNCKHHKAVKYFEENNSEESSENSLGVIPYSGFLWFTVTAIAVIAAWCIFFTLGLDKK
eukprot:Nk52_evm25s262 gene=Nk52_evmTU25s262